MAVDLTGRRPVSEVIVNRTRTGPSCSPTNTSNAAWLQPGRRQRHQPAPAGGLQAVRAITVVERGGPSPRRHGTTIDPGRATARGRWLVGDPGGRATAASRGELTATARETGAPAAL
jgi:hypothetical protein